jgi:hypothetical protein
MTHDRYAPPIARVGDGPESRILWPLLIALLAGVASWLAAIASMKWAYQQFWLPSLEAGRPIPGQLDTVLAVSAVYGAFGAAIAFLRVKPWWTPLPTFLTGTVIYIGLRGWFSSRGMATFLVDVLLGHIFLSGLVASSASFFLVSRSITARSNKSLERTRGR